jgi:hypothetical protein
MVFGIFCGYLAIFVAIWYILWSFDVFFARFVVLCKGKSGNSVTGSVSQFWASLRSRQLCEKSH